ncbi:MAG: cation diffusion facilitator family transporter [Opitutaceae bacterium]|jgi:cation diffusion facilitator family transporter|nr:cation diffusion facilitator family transporter [Opitutaceae bacterium]
MSANGTSENRPDGLLLKGILLNAALGALKLAGGALGHSQALVADAAESLLDTLTSAIAWTGFRLAAAPPDANHPYGHGKAEALVACAIALLIYATAGFVAAGAIGSLREPAPDAAPGWWTLPLLAVIILVKFAYARRVAGASRASGGGALLHAEARHHLADAITSAAAFVGILLALAGGEKWRCADAWAALFACVVIAANGTQILQRALVDIMDAAAPPEIERAVRAAALGVPGALDVHKCRIRKSGSFYLVDIQVVVDAGLTVRRGHAIAHEVKDALVRSPLRVADVSVHIEPSDNRPR